MRIVIVMLTAFVAVGCTRTVYVPREVARKEYRDRIQYDSVYMRDSILVREKGDTVYVYVDRWRDKYHVLRDTVRLVDSVSYPVVVEVEKQVRHIPRVYRWALWFSLAALGVAVFRVIRRLRVLR